MQQVERHGAHGLEDDIVAGFEDLPLYVIPAEAFGNDLDLQGDRLDFRQAVLIGSLSHNSRIVWRKGTTVGVDFIDEHHSIF